MYAEAFGFGAGACVAGCCGGGGGFDPFAQFRSMPTIFFPNNKQQLKNNYCFVFLLLFYYLQLFKHFRVRNYSKRRTT